LAKKSSIPNATIRGTSGEDVPLHGTAGDDVIAALNGNDQILAVAGNDLLYGGRGSDEINGGDNDPLPNYRLLEEGIDGDRGDQASFKGLSYAVAASLVTSKASELDDNGFIVRSGDQDTLIGIESLTGTGFDDTLEGNGSGNVLEGKGGDDEIFGLGGNDLLIGDRLGATKGGNDLLKGGNGDDVLLGNAGSDILDGGAGNDVVIYADAEGIVVDLASNRVEENGTFTDTLIEIEEIIGSPGDDSIFGDDNTNILQGSGGKDLIDGRGGSDVLIGGSGSDTVMGGDGNDILQGGNGRDTLIGNDDNDILIGGAGKDMFVFEYSRGDQVEGADVIDDFNLEADKLHFNIDGFLGNPNGKELFKLLDTNINKILDDGDDKVSVAMVSGSDGPKDSTVIAIGAFLGTSADTVTLYDSVDLTAKSFA
jgi:Ca2+-binding RTX toxin-like protein